MSPSAAPCPAMGRRSWTAMPTFAAKLVFGEMAEEMLLASQMVVPGRLADAGFKFEHETIEAALAEAFGDKEK